MAEAREITKGLEASASLTIEDRFKGPGYAKVTSELLDTLCAVARTEGIVLDPVYTAKAFAAIETLCREGQLRGKRVLFLHSGGAFGLMPWGEALQKPLEAADRHSS